MLKGLLLVLGLICAAQELRAWDVREGDNDLYYWFMGGFGTTAQEWAKLGVAAGLDVCLMKSNRVVMLRWMQNKEADPQPVGDEEFTLERTPDEDIDEVAVLIGITKTTSQFIYLAAAGFSYIRGVRRGDLLRRDVISNFTGGSIREFYEQRVFETIGLPVSLQFSAQALPMFGIGVELFGNANPERSYIGCLLGIQFGHLR